MLSELLDVQGHYWVDHCKLHHSCFLNFESFVSLSFVQLSSVMAVRCAIGFKTAFARSLLQVHDCALALFEYYLPASKYADRSLFGHSLVTGVQLCDHQFAICVVASHNAHITSIFLDVLGLAWLFVMQMASDTIRQQYVASVGLRACLLFIFISFLNIFGRSLFAGIQICDH